MEDALKKLGEYIEAVRQHDFWSHRKCILEDCESVTALYVILVDKGLTTKEEFDNTVERLKENEFADARKAIEENLSTSEAKKERLAKEIVEIMKTLEKDPIEQLQEALFGGSGR